MTALLAGLVLLPPVVTAAAADVPGRAVSAGRTVDALRSGTVTLPTGQQVRLAGPADGRRVLVQDAGTDALARTLVTREVNGRTYVLPAIAEPYLGRFLEPGLFDVTSLGLAPPADGRLNVRISYTGATPSIPGVRILSAADGTATGYLTPQSSAEFGRALAAQWRADTKAGWPERETLFEGVRRIGATGVTPPGQATPRFPMYTLTIRTLGYDGQPLPQSSVALMNVDDGRMYSGFVNLTGGSGQVSVPAGTYTAIGDQFSLDQATGGTAMRITTVNEFEVTGPGQTLTLDHRRASASPSVEVPKAATISSHYLVWTHRDVASAGWTSSGFFLDPRTKVLLAPSPKAEVGSINLMQNWVLNGPGTAPEYSYTVASLRDEIPENLADTFTDADMATVRSSYYGDGTAPTAGLMRTASYPNVLSGGYYERTPRGSRRTEYVAGNGPVRWTDSAVTNQASTQDPGRLDGPTRELPAGSTTDLSWFRGPLGAAVPHQVGDGTCYACRTDDRLLLSLAPFTDSDPTHTGGLFAAEDGVPVARFQLYRGDELVADGADTTGIDIQIPVEEAAFRAVLDVDRRLIAPAQSTQSRTELTFRSRSGDGAPLPSNWRCEADGCRVLPLLQAKVTLPTALDGRLPAGTSRVSVTVGRVQGAGTAEIDSAGLEIRPAGGDWTPVTLTGDGNGTWGGEIDNTPHAGKDVDVRVSGTDTDGSKVVQTVLKAYTVAAP